ncbi:hypothetical protein LCGC14_2793060, partial [marine sediment metagenome]
MVRFTSKTATRFIGVSWDNSRRTKLAQVATQDFRADHEWQISNTIHPSGHRSLRMTVRLPYKNGFL